MRELGEAPNSSGVTKVMTSTFRTVFLAGDFRNDCRRLYLICGEPAVLWDEVIVLGAVSRLEQHREQSPNLARFSVGRFSPLHVANELILLRISSGVCRKV